MKGTVKHERLFPQLFDRIRHERVFAVGLVERPFMKRFLLLFTLCVLLCGCENPKADINSDSVITVNTTFDETEEDTANYTVTTDGITSDSKITAKEMWAPDIFDSGKRTIENVVFPWTDDLIEEAWQMSYLSDNFTSYLDRCFCDLDGDGDSELFLTANNIFFSISVYKLNDGKIQYLGTIDFDGFIGRSVLTVPPTDPKITDPENEMWNFNTAQETNRNFEILQDKENKCYFSGYGISNNDRQCFVINISIENDQLLWQKVYQWGHLWAYDADIDSGGWFAYYILYDENDESISITQQDVDNFIAQLS